MTLHGTNGIIIQPSKYEVSNTVTQQTYEPSSVRRRSFKPVHMELQPYIRSKHRPNPLPIQDIDMNLNQIDGLISKHEDLLWSVIRHDSGENQNIPSWKGFFFETSKLTTEKYVVGYLPTIGSSPTKMETVKEVLLQCKEKAQELNLSETDLVLDHAIYSKAVEIIMEEQHVDLRKFINLRMGGFHATCIFLGAIGKRFCDSGLKDVVVEAGVLGEDATQQVLQGKHYNKGMRVYMYVAEAITRIKIDTFIEWMRGHNKTHVYLTTTESDEVKNIEAARNSDNFNDCIEIFQDVSKLYEEFEAEFSDEKRYPMAVFWNSYLSMIQTLRDYAKSIKIGDWDLHMFASEKMMYWFHAYGHFNYARNFSYYWSSQQILQDQHPSIFENFKDGHFSTRRSKGKFNKVSPDQIMEQTINKDQKGKGKYNVIVLSF